MTGFVPPTHAIPATERPLRVGGVVLENPSAIPLLRERTDTLMKSWGFERVPAAPHRIATLESVLQ